MRSVFLLFSLVFLTFSVNAQKARIIKSPAALPEEPGKTKIFLAGSIDMGNAENWQETVTEQLSDQHVLLLNPRRDDWNKDWKPVSSDKNFREQVEWELNALEAADIIIMYFDPASKSPISLLELGLYARTDKLMVVCPDGYWRKGNVEIVTEKYGINMYDSLGALIKTLKEKIH